MPSFPVFTISQIDAISRIIGECGTGSDISRIFDELNIVDNSNESTKWKRIYFAFNLLQKQNKSSSIANIIKTLLAPERFIGNNDLFEEHRKKLNVILAFTKVEYQKDGNFYTSKAVKTIDEAEERVSNIRKKLKGRAIHTEIFKYCEKEYMQENYFHAVFEATKGLAQRIRELSGIDGDGAVLIDKVFSIKSPILVFNTLQTETEQSEHVGFATLLKGCFGAIRNPLAHVPKILWDGEDDAADYMTLISLLHRKLDKCIKVPMKDIK